jgi:ketosteroid isomerase-like protein
VLGNARVTFYPVGMTDTAALVTEFYSAFQRKDATTMGALYHDQAEFSDPVFPSLDAEHVRGMWRMFCDRPDSDLDVQFSEVRSTGSDSATAHWDARYTFRTGRKVLNQIDAAFTFKDGKILRHVDTSTSGSGRGKPSAPSGCSSAGPRSSATRSRSSAAPASTSS